MKVRIKKLVEHSVIPEYARNSDAGMDLVAISKNRTNDYIEYGTGLAVEIPEGYVGLIFPRSSISTQNLVLANSVGVIDSGYRGEIKIRFKKVRNQTTTRQTDNWTLEDEQPSHIYNISDKVAQLIIIPHPKVVFEVVDELTETARGVGGFGSSGR